MKYLPEPGGSLQLASAAALFSLREQKIFSKLLSDCLVPAHVVLLQLSATDPSGRCIY